MTVTHFNCTLRHTYGLKRIRRKSTGKFVAKIPNLLVRLIDISETGVAALVSI